MYNPKAIKNDINVEKIKDLQRAVLDNTADFLKIEHRSLNDKKLFKNREMLADRIILAIESYFTVACLTCASELILKMRLQMM